MRTYRIYKKTDKWWNYPYRIKDENGYLIGVASTFWGAKRVIKKDIKELRKRTERKNLRENEELVYEEECTD